jgi:hypothetical protein
MSTNDITGARLISKANTKDYDEGYDRIFSKNKHWLEETIEGIHSMPTDRCIIYDNEVEVVND